MLNAVTLSLLIHIILQDINLKGTLFVARALARSSAGRQATFVFTGTAASYFASERQSAYITSKAACNVLLSQLHIGR